MGTHEHSHIDSCEFMAKLTTILKVIVLQQIKTKKSFRIIQVLLPSEADPGWK